MSVHADNVAGLDSLTPPPESRLANLTIASAKRGGVRRQALTLGISGWLAGSGFILARIEELAPQSRL
jgi:hypothetical protein